MSDFTTRPEIRGTFGVVTSTHWLASAVGMSILERGGNAFDAAVAAGFTLQIVEPHLNGPGGEVPILFYSADEARVQALCGQGVAPAAATIDRYRWLGFDLMPGAGLLATVVPGAFGAWLSLLRDHGTMALSDVLAPAIYYARNGFPLLPRVVDAIGDVRELFETEWPTSAAIYLKGGSLPKPGALFRNEALAATYQRILDESRWAGKREAQIDAAHDLYYRGFVAESLAAFCRQELMDSSGRRNRGLLTADDLAAWHPHYEEPVGLDYRDCRVLKCGPWSQGPVFLQQLALLAGFELDGLDPCGADFVHLVTECAKLAFADREAYYGDPKFTDVPLDGLLDPAYGAARRALVGESASLELCPGQIENHTPRLPDLSGAQAGDASIGGAGEPTMARLALGPGDTCHLDVIDRDGNMVAATPSGGWLQSSPAVPELGFCLNSRAQMYWLEEGLPASLAPGKRPRTTLSPSFALRDGEPYLAFGTPGGDQQDQWTVTFFLRHLHHGMNLQESIEAPLFHSSHWPSSFYPRQAEPGRLDVEGRFSAATIAELRRRGHRVEVDEDWAIGRMTAAAKDGDQLKAAATPRGMQGYAVGR